MDFISENVVSILLVGGIVFLLAEVAVFGFSAIVLLFIGLALLSTAALVALGMFLPSLSSCLISIALLSAFFGIILWRPLQRLQNAQSSTKNHVVNDLIGIQFLLPSTLTRTSATKTRYSGIDWRVELDDDALTDQVDAEEKVTVTKVDVGVFFVKPAHEIF